MQIGRIVQQLPFWQPKVPSDPDAAALLSYRLDTEVGRRVGNIRTAAGSEDGGTAWHVRAPDRSAIAFEDGPDGLVVHVRDGGKPCYLIQGARNSEFQKLKVGNGVEVSPGLSYALAFKVDYDPELLARVWILEYDKNGVRIGRSVFQPSEDVTYLPGENVRKIVVTLRLEGVGRFFFREFGWTTPSAAASASATTGAKAEKPTNGVANGHANGAWPMNAAHLAELGAAKTPSAADELLASIPASVEIAGLLRYAADGVLNKIKTLEEKLKKAEQQVEKFSAEFYKWRRRALQWEKKAKELEAREPVAPASTPMLKPALVELAKTLPKSNGSTYFEPLPFRLAIVADVYMYNYYKDAFESCVYVSPDDVDRVISEEAFDAFLYTTCWSGISNDEWRGVKFREKPKNALDKILAHCRENKVPTIFQSIEDPSNFEYFLPIAKQFDVVYTSDADVIERYKEACGHGRVYYLEYGVNPQLHNPIGSRRHSIDAAFFAGSYPTRYPERCADMQLILDAVAKEGSLVVADRNFGATATELQYPEKYRQFLMPPIEHDLLQSMHKLFRFNLNFNSIKHSGTMCAMRVYELQALGKAVISNYALSVMNTFHDIRIAAHEEDLVDLFAPATVEDYRAETRALRAVMTDLTCYDLAARIMKEVGRVDPAVERPRVALVVTATDDAAARARVDAQSYLHKKHVGVEALRAVADWPAYCKEHNIRFVAFFADGDEYGHFYLQDMINAFKYTKSRYVTKNAVLKDGAVTEAAQHDYTALMPAKARTVFDAARLDLDWALGLGWRETVADLPGGYAVDPFEYAEGPAVKTTPRLQAADAELSVIVPVFNNGRFLEGRCVPSLRRNAVWPKLDVILIDDGSTDAETLDICRRLVARHGNVRLEQFGPGGSGSASRPRNRGLDMSWAPLVTFLDPDNEISPGGYDKMMALYAREAPKGGVSFVSGYHVKIDKAVRQIGKHTDAEAFRQEKLEEYFFKRGRFPVVSTQAAVISRKLFEDGAFRFVERAAGQDTLFGWELLCRADGGVFTGAAYIKYYAERPTSVTNTLDAEYFEKKLVMETAQVAVLKERGLFDLFMTHHWDNFVKNWYLPKLEGVVPSERAKAVAILEKILALYGRSLSDYEVAAA